MKRSGYTLVEIVLVITMLGIIAAIALVSWNTVAMSSRDKAREQDVRMWAAAFDIYKGRYMAYPVMPDAVLNYSVACLGKFASTSNKCGEYQSAGSFDDSTADALITEIKRVGNAPNNSGPNVKNTFVGPVAYVWKPAGLPPYTVSADFLNYFEGNCPSDFTDVTTTAPYNIIISSANGTRLCKYTKSFTFDPN